MFMEFLKSMGSSALYVEGKLSSFGVTKCTKTVCIYRAEVLGDLKCCPWFYCTTVYPEILAIIKFGDLCKIRL